MPPEPNRPGGYAGGQRATTLRYLRPSAVCEASVRMLWGSMMVQALQPGAWSGIGESLATRWGTKPSQARGIDTGTDDSGGTVLPAICLVDRRSARHWHFLYWYNECHA